jgi:hypothetical protein
MNQSQESPAPLGAAPSEAEAIAQYQRALRVDPDLMDVRRDLAQLLVTHGRQTEAMPLFRQELLARGSATLAWLQSLISAQLPARDLTLAGQYAEILARLRWGSETHMTHEEASATQLAIAPILTLTNSKLAHDIEQFEYLRCRGLLASEHQAVIHEYRKILDQLKLRGEEIRVELDSVEHKAIHRVYGRLLHVRDSPRMARSLSETWDATALEEEYLGKPPGVVVVDDFLSPAALEELRLFCLESTVWSTNRYARGRLGAFFQDGFNCRLILQIAEELRQALPRVIGDRYPLRQIWAFKHTKNSSGDSNTHADFAAINVNFWITPTDANLDESSGGLLVYPVCAPRDWPFEIYNKRADLINQRLAALQVRPIRISYRQNRAVIFNSDLFHGTEDLAFRPGYENHRINVTMLYGNRENDAHHPQLATQGADGGALPGGSALRSFAFARSGRFRR